MTKWLVGVALAALAVGLWAFEPWRLVTSSEIDEPLPATAVEAVTESSVAASAKPTKKPAPSEKVSGAPSKQAEKSSPPPPQDRVLATGPFERAEHATSGQALVLELADGSRFVRLENLATSDGPDLHVWVTDQPSGGEWGSYDDGRYVRLGELKATNGNQNYSLPAEADLRGLTTVVIWCDRFDVAFGTAPIVLG